MLFLVALIPATALTVGGYVALFLSHRSEGSLRTFGRYLGIWAFVLAALVALGGMFAAGHMHRMHAGMWGGRGGPHGAFMERRDDGRMWERREHGEPGAPPAKPPAGPPEGPAGQPTAPPPPAPK
ncbi:MAG TPA: hypothetical protein VEH00_15085 [Steroidobacteraceae bacterium]|nr:hypothetical protein [Steroidobacteraceae bacterium]